MDFEMTTNGGPGPVRLEAKTPLARDTRESGWLEGPRTAELVAACLVADGFKVAVDGAPVMLAPDCETVIRAGV